MKKGMGGRGSFFNAVMVGRASAFPQGSANDCPMLLMHMQQSLAV